MTEGAYRRLSGILRLNGRSPILESIEHGMIRLRTGDDLSAYADRNVTVEGHVRRPTLMELVWIGPSSD
jgi:hypothetical protein